MKDELFNELIDSINESGAILKGETKPSHVFEITPLDVQTIRKKYNLSQEKFAHLLGIGVSTLRNWEQGRRQTKMLLKVADKPLML